MLKIFSMNYSYTFITFGSDIIPYILLNPSRNYWVSQIFQVFRYDEVENPMSSTFKSKCLPGF